MAGDSEYGARAASTWPPWVFLTIGFLTIALMLLAYFVGRREPLSKEIRAGSAAVSKMNSQAKAFRDRAAPSDAELQEKAHLAYVTARALQRRYTTLSRAAFTKELSERVKSIPGVGEVNVGSLAAASPFPKSGGTAAPASPPRTRGAAPSSSSPPRMGIPPSPTRAKPSAPSPAGGQAPPGKQVAPGPLLMPASIKSTMHLWQIKFLCESARLYPVTRALEMLDLPGWVIQVEIAERPLAPGCLDVTATYGVYELSEPDLARELKAEPGKIAKMKDHIFPELAKDMSSAGGPLPPRLAADEVAQSRFPKMVISKIICSKACPEESVAVVNGFAVRAGDTIAGAKVAKIEPDGVIVSIGMELMKVKP